MPERRKVAYVRSAPRGHQRAPQKTRSGSPSVLHGLESARRPDLRAILSCRPQPSTVMRNAR
ncbi:hypothetical protein CKO25_00355 [Thiocapsa imhoffii]|uniref:Uncharacterized protein n=1 Tax=Thiocapsa imhoffii TaxID=382777 RepID=A0A9X1B6U8_9GAMM|nr:hypothetical protein [Thiocapsa imhoffii]